MKQTDDLFEYMNTLTAAQTSALLEHVAVFPLDERTERRLLRRLHRKLTPAEPRGGKSALAWLIPLAACAILALALAVNPKTAQAISNWFSGFFSHRVEEYFHEPPETREENADLEQAISTPLMTEQTTEVIWLDETGHLAGANAYRREIGKPAFDRTDYAWVEQMNPCVEELLYDGQKLLIRSRFDVSPMKFAGGYIPNAPDGAERFDIWCYEAFCTANGETVEADVGDNGPTLPWIYYDREKQAWDTQRLLSDDKTYVQTSLENGACPAFPNGRVSVTLDIWVFDGEIDDMAPVGLIAIVRQTVTFDATEGNALLSNVETTQSDWSGEAMATFTASIQGKNEMQIQNRMLDLSKVRVICETTRRVTGLNVKLTYDYPKAWDALGEWQWYADLWYDLYVDGAFVSRLRQNMPNPSAIPSLDIPLTPSELASVKRVVLIPVKTASEAYLQFDAPYESGEEPPRDNAMLLPLDEILTFPMDNSVYFFYAETVLTGCELNIPVV